MGELQATPGEELLLGKQESLLRIKPWAFVRTGFVFEAKYHSGELKCKLLATCTRPTKHAPDPLNRHQIHLT